MDSAACEDDIAWCVGQGARECIQKYRQGLSRRGRSAATDPSSAVMYLPLNARPPQKCPSTAETSLVGISQMVFLWTVLSVLSAVGNVVGNINNNQNNNNNNDNNVNLNIISTHSTSISANTNNANSISIMLPPPIPILAGGRQLEADAKLGRLLSQNRQQQQQQPQPQPQQPQPNARSPEEISQLQMQNQSPSVNLKSH